MFTLTSYSVELLAVAQFTDAWSLAISRSVYAHRRSAEVFHTPSTPPMTGPLPLEIVAQPWESPPVYCSTHPERCVSVTVPVTCTGPHKYPHPAGEVMNAIGGVLSTI